MIDPIVIVLGSLRRLIVRFDSVLVGSVMCFFLAVPWIGRWTVIVAYPSHN